MNKTGTNKPNNAFVVHRKLSIPAILGKDCARMIRESFFVIDGVQEIVMDMDHKTMRITYDASQIGFDEIERLLSECGYPVSGSWWSRYKSGWYSYLDENARANAKSKDGACCGNPGNIYANRRK
jgi:hypothetical protein